MIEKNCFQTPAEKGQGKTKKLITEFARQPTPERWADHSKALMKHRGSSSHRDNQIALSGRKKEAATWYGQHMHKKLPKIDWGLACKTIVHKHYACATSASPKPGERKRATSMALGTTRYH